MYAVVEGIGSDQQHYRTEPARELESERLVCMNEGVVGVNRYRNGGRGKSVRSFVRTLLDDRNVLLGGNHLLLLSVTPIQNEKARDRDRRQYGGVP